jgi:hypothetical protein
MKSIRRLTCLAAAAVAVACACTPVLAGSDLSLQIVPVGSEAAADSALLRVYNRPIFTFRSSLGASTPHDRVVLSERAAPRCSTASRDRYAPKQ